MIPKTQKQWIVRGDKGFDPLEFQAEALIPSIGDRDVLVKSKDINFAASRSLNSAGADQHATSSRCIAEFSRLAHTKGTLIWKVQCRSALVFKVSPKSFCSRFIFPIFRSNRCKESTTILLFYFLSSVLPFVLLRSSPAVCIRACILFRSKTVTFLYLMAQVSLPPSGLAYTDSESVTGWQLYSIKII